MHEITLAGRYCLDGKISDQSRAEIWRGRDLVLGRAIVAKMMRSQLTQDAGAARSFQAAALTAARLMHPHTLAVFDTGIEQGRPYIVCEYVSGGDFEKQIRKGPLDVTEVARVGMQAASALAYAHAQGIVHGNLTATDILLTEDGSAKLKGFFEPDQNPSSRHSATDDVVALASILLNALARPAGLGRGARPAPRRMLGNSRKRKPQTLLQIEAVLRSALQQGPSRPQTALELSETLEHFTESDLQQGARARPHDGHSFAKTEGRYLVVGVALLFAAVTVVSAVRWLASNERGPSGNSSVDQTTSLTISRALPFDPFGDGAEHNDQAALSIDRNTSTAWTTQRYSSADLGRLKPGVGLYIDLGRAQALTSIEVSSPAAGWTAELRAADRLANTLDSWAPISPPRPMQRRTVFSFRSTKHRYWLIWITKLAVDQGFAASVSEVRPSHG